MRVFLDHCVPAPLAKLIAGHDVMTARSAGFDSLRDPELLSRLDGICDVLVTVDRSLPFQNTLARRSYGVIILRPKRNVLLHLAPMVPQLHHALGQVQAGRVMLVEPQ